MRREAPPALGVIALERSARDAAPVVAHQLEAIGQRAGRKHHRDLRVATHEITMLAVGSVAPLRLLERIQERPEGLVGRGAAELVARGAAVPEVAARELARVRIDEAEVRRRRRVRGAWRLPVAEPAGDGRLVDATTPVDGFEGPFSTASSRGCSRTLRPGPENLAQMVL